jgi:hypothetical protein
MATARMGMSSIFGAVTQTATTITTTLEAINAGIGMANSAITSMAERQSIRHALGDAAFEQEVVNEYATELAQLNIAAAKFRDTSQAHAAAFDSAHSLFTEVLAKRKK